MEIAARPAGTERSLSDKDWHGISMPRCIILTIDSDAANPTDSARFTPLSGDKVANREILDGNFTLGCGEPRAAEEASASRWLVAR
jgi:hypothetical protein